MIPFAQHAYFQIPSTETNPFLEDCSGWIHWFSSFPTVHTIRFISNPCLLTSSVALFLPSLLAKAHAALQKVDFWTSAAAICHIDETGKSFRQYHMSGDHSAFLAATPGVWNVYTTEKNDKVKLPLQVCKLSSGKKSLIV